MAEQQAGPAESQSGPGERAGQPKPHDSFFAGVFSLAEHVASLLLSVLPPALVAMLDLAQLTPAPTRYPGSTLSQLHADLAHSVPVGGVPGMAQVEHQSTRDPGMAVRMLGYLAAFWSTCKPGALVPPVIPVVVYNGREKWDCALDVADRVDLSEGVAEALGASLPRFSYFLVDLSQVTLDQLRAWPLTPLARLALVVLKIAPGSRDVAAELARSWMTELRAVAAESASTPHLVRLWYYLVAVSNVPAREIEALAAAVGQNGQEAYMTAAQELKAEGEVRGKIKALKEVLTIRFGDLPPDINTKVDTASVDDLQKWFPRAVTAPSLDVVFR